MWSRSTILICDKVICDSELKIEGYNLYSNELSGKGRRVALYVKQEVRCNLLYVDSKYDDFVVLQIDSGVDEKLLIGIFYRSPNNSPESDEEFFFVNESGM